MGSRKAPVIITEFADFQCPYCQRLAAVLKQIQAEHPADVAVSFRHFPLPRLHKHARAASLSAECAGAQGRFANYHDWLFAHPDSIGVAPWASIARMAGVSDTVAFARCLADSTFLARLASDSIAGRKVNLRGTPTVLVNGLRLTVAPTRSVLDDLISQQLKLAK